MNLFIFILAILSVVQTASLFSFTVDYEHNCFLKDGKPFRYMSGSLHYFRVPSEYWSDRIHKMKMAGLNAIQTYVEWNHHEPEPGVFNFVGDYHLPRFLETAKDSGMLVILRTGPFIDAERDMGGLPYWLLRVDPNMKLRSFDSNYIKYVERWYRVLLPLIKPYLYKNGGPIITIQIENEYGSIGCDAQYKSFLRDLFRKYLGRDAVLFTTDGSASSALACGKTDEVLSTIDFGAGANVTHNFEMLRWTQASGPLVNSEFYPGWLDHWGQPHAQVSSDSVVQTLVEMLQANASVNVYMFHGGTSFGFSAGSNLGGTFQACPTSYDYDAPLDEAGDPTPKYYAMREAIGKFLPLPPGDVPKPAPKMNTKPIIMERVFSLFEFLRHAVINQTFSTHPLSFEDLHHPYGFVLYETTVSVTPTDPAVLTVEGIADRAHVYVEEVLQGILSREQKIESIPINVLSGQKIQILVENQGRICSGNSINDRKGIFGNVTLCSRPLSNWTMTPVPLGPSSLPRGPLSRESAGAQLPAFYAGTFTMEGTISDTFLKLDGWHKGVAFLNNFNLGRYWPIIGPQVTLYTPRNVFVQGVNTLVLLELERAPEDACFIQFVDTPNVNGTTPTG